MSTNALAGAVLGAIIGAAAWAAIAYFTGYEVGYVAWGVGAVVGGLAAKFGSEGSTAGLVCGGLALASILVGKVVATNLVFSKEVEKAAKMFIGPELYTELASDAAAFDKLGSEAEYPQFMVERGFSDQLDAADVTAAEVAAFKRESLPELQPFRGGARPDRGIWVRDRRAQLVDEAKAEFSAIDAVTEELGLVDIVFALLGVGTAFKLGEGLATGGGGGPGGARRRRHPSPGHPPGETPHDEPPSAEPPPDQGLPPAPVRTRRRR
ncbi:MAG: hypothetical protein QNJ98_16035 [Planctomycetota bacterium]|nr:hypothetical protein [Planctomycetota bacterium]